MGMWQGGQFGGQVTFVNLDGESDKRNETAHSCFRARCIVPEWQDRKICHSHKYIKCRKWGVTMSSHQTTDQICRATRLLVNLLFHWNCSHPINFFNVMLRHIKKRTELVSVLMSEYPKGAHIFCSYFNLCIFSGGQSGSSHKASTTNSEIKITFARMGIFFKGIFSSMLEKEISKREFSIHGELHPIVALFLMWRQRQVNLAICPHLLSDFSFNYG